MVMSTDTDILEYVPDLYDYGIQDFTGDHVKTRGDIIRRLNIEWYPRTDWADSSNSLDESLLTEAQFTRAAVFHVLSYYILPKLTQFGPDGDKFTEMMKYYKDRYNEEFEAVLNGGVEYDANANDIIESGETPMKQVAERLVR